MPAKFKLAGNAFAENAKHARAQKIFATRERRFLDARATFDVTTTRSGNSEFLLGLKRRWMLNSEVMKNMTRGIVFLLAALAAPVICGGQPDSGVAEVDVVVKQSPHKRRITDERGSFSFEGLAPGSYTLTFRARKADLLPETTKSEVIVATGYSIKVEGTKRSVNQRGLTTDKLIAGVDIPVEVGPGAKILGQVLAHGPKRMVWIAPEVGSQMPGHWADADSKEAARFHNIVQIRNEDLRRR
jgi:hypothetical protein